jgi:hypothetical protein
MQRTPPPKPAAGQSLFLVLLAASVASACLVQARRATAADTAAQSLLNQIDHCSVILDETERLGCYDTIAARGAKPQGAIYTLGGGNGEGIPTSQPNPTSGHPYRPIRLGVGYTYAFGNYAGALITSGGSVDADSLVSGLGDGFTAEAWMDDWPMRNLSIGVEYLQVNNRAAVSATFPKGLSILTDPVSARLNLILHADVGFINLAYRPSAPGLIRPVVGLGIGGGAAHLTTNEFVYNDFFGTYRGSTNSRAPFVGIQGFVGIEGDFKNDVYFSVTPTVLVVSGHPIGINQRYLDFMLQTKIGYRFQ